MVQKHIWYLQVNKHTEPNDCEANGKLGSYLRTKTRVLKSLLRGLRLYAVRAVDGATHSQNDSVEANVVGRAAWRRW